MEPKIIDDPNAPKGAITAAFSFRKHFNILKRIGQPATNLVNRIIPPEAEVFKEWLLKNGAILDRVSYPAYFSETENIVYPGVVANKNIDKNEVSEYKQLGSH